MSRASRSRLARGGFTPAGVGVVARTLSTRECGAIANVVPKRRVAQLRQLVVYIEDAEGAAKVLGLRTAHARANVVLLLPQDDSLFASAENRDGLRTAALPLVVADLHSGPGRSPAEAEALMEWMAAKEEMWRGWSRRTTSHAV